LTAKKMRTIHASFLFVLCLLLVLNSAAFLSRLPNQAYPITADITTSPQNKNEVLGSSATKKQAKLLPISVQRQRRSVASIQTMGIFGLGLPEIGIILVAVAFVLGPQTLGKLAKSSATLANEYKEELSRVPDEFKKGLEEGETDARARKAKPVKVLPKEERE
jgi:Sec-independent protein translocase protein TatA